MGDDLQRQQPTASTAETRHEEHEREITVGLARVAISDNPASGPPVQQAVLRTPVHEALMPKDGMAIPSVHHDEVSDCTIIGAGTTGLYAAFYAGMREMSVKIIDSLGDLGGQVCALYPEKYIYDVAGFPEIKGKDLVAMCAKQGLQFGPTVCLGERVEKVTRDADGIFTLTTNKSEHRSRTVIIAAGVGAFAPRKLPKAPELDELEGTSVFYFIRDLQDFRGKKVLIVGGGDSAMDWTLGLEPVAEHVTLIHRRDRWRAHEDTVNKVMRSSATVKVFHEVRAVHRENGAISGVTIFDNRTQEETELAVDRIVLCLGFIANIGPIKDWGLELADGGIVVDSTMSTTIPGIFAAGDVTRFAGKLNLIATGFAEAATAANYAKNFIDPHSRVFPGHSSEKSKEGQSAIEETAAAD